jgi:hypothetical protein
MEPKAQQANFTLPDSTSTLADVSSLSDELEQLENFLRQASVRQTGTPMTLPKFSPAFDHIVADNNLNMLQAEHRDYLMQTLGWLREHAPQVHMSFSAEPSRQFLTKLTNWGRQNISPILLVRVGMQPTIGVGCMLRTTNKIFDLSLKKRFEEQKSLLVEELIGKKTSSAGGVPPKGQVK